MGPVLFFVMVNDLLTEWTDLWKYVDDSTFNESIVPDCNSNLQELLNYIYNWTTLNNMKLNVTKCKELVIDFAKAKRGFPLFIVDGVVVGCVEFACILRLIVQDNMNWNEYVNQIVKKAGKRLSMLRLFKRSNADINI